ncbi:MAG: translation initiation factor IF-3 [Candidatus Paceibacterota bacterium]
MYKKYVPPRVLVRLNGEIRAQEVRVLDEKNESLGVFSTQEALKMATERGVDLIETVPNATPPITKLITYDKYRYQREKEEKKERLAQKTAGLKQVQISARAAQNDLLVKVRQLEKFLKEGHQVEINMRLRGREKGNKEWASQKLNDFFKMIPIEFKIMSPPKFGGRGMFVQISSK